MTAAELDERRKGCLKGILEGASSKDAELAKVEALFLIAIGLAELNEKLTAKSLVGAIIEIQDTLDAPKPLPADYRPASEEIKRELARKKEANS